MYIDPTMVMKKIMWTWLGMDYQWWIILPENNIQPAPKDILKMMKCGCVGTCDCKKCTCRKNDMKCIVASKNCKGISFSNIDNNEHYLDDVVENDEMM